MAKLDDRIIFNNLKKILAAALYEPSHVLSSSEEHWIEDRVNDAIYTSLIVNRGRKNWETVVDVLKNKYRNKKISFDDVFLVDR